MRRNTQRSLMLATYLAAPCFALKFEGDDTTKGAGGDDKTKDKKPEVKKIELTEEEITAREKAAVDAALTKERNEAATKKKKDDDEAAVKKAKEEGDFKKLADDAQRERDEAKTALANLQHTQAIDRAVAKAAKDHAEYPLDVFNEYVAPKVASTVKIGADEKEIDKAAKDAVKAYTEANPRNAKTNTPSNPARNTQQQPNNQRISSNRSNGVARSRF